MPLISETAFKITVDLAGTVPQKPPLYHNNLTKAEILLGYSSSSSNNNNNNITLL
jgi:hypothetical protein